MKGIDTPSFLLVLTIFTNNIKTLVALRVSLLVVVVVVVVVVLVLVLKEKRYGRLSEDE